jgi:Hint domain
MTSELQNSDIGTQRTRRNIMKMGAIAVPATFATIHSAAAGDCLISLGKVCLFPPGGTVGGGGSSSGGGGGHCFLKGTKILAAEGERNIEDLAVGDLLPTMFGGLRPVQWIGAYSLKKSDPSKRWAEEAQPVRIARSALGPNLPHADLYVTALHSILIDGVLVQAEALINGATITRCAPEADELEFFHIKLESHDVVYAEGVAAETLLNVDESFLNFAEYLRRYGAPSTEETRCAPYVPVQGGRVEMISRLRSALSPWVDFRTQADVVRDKIEEGAYTFV